MLPGIFLEQFSISFLIVPRAPIITGTFVVLSPHIRLLSSCIIYCFESNLNNTVVRKKEKYLNLINEMSRNYRCVRFVNLSMSSLGVFSDECSTFLDMMNDIGIDKKQQLYIIKKMINIAIRATYYIFCCRNRNWDSPDNAILIFFSF